MKFTTSLPEISKDAPFANDILERKSIADVLTQMIDNSDTGFTLSLNASWGNGKTTFVNMWKAHLESQNYRTIYINAWEQDYLQDPFSIIISTIWKELSVYSGTNIATGEESLKSLASIVWDIVKFHTGKVVGEKTIEDFENIIKTRGVPEFISICSSYPKLIEKFKKQLGDIVNKICEQKKLVIFVDELDRCRPNFAVEFLERIKHIFAIPNIVFVLSIDKDVLCSAIKGFYGSEQIDAERYLRRFIDIEYNLPTVSRRNFIEQLYTQYGLGKYNQDSTLDYSGKGIIYALVDLLENPQLCLRDVEKYIIRLQLATTALNRKNINQATLAMLLYLHMFHKDIYQNIKCLKYKLSECLLTLEKVLCWNEDRENVNNYLDLIIDLYNVYKSYVRKEYNIKFDDYNDVDVSSFQFVYIRHSNLKNILDINYATYSPNLRYYIEVIEVFKQVI